jgi:hypothetical protein
MNVRQPANAKILRYLERPGTLAGRPDVRAPGDLHHDYWESGAHPEIVERVWDQLGRDLPASFFNLEWTSPTCTCLVCSACGYVHWFLPQG